MPTAPSAYWLEEVWRREAPHVLGALLRRHSDFHTCEDATQEALLAASQQWPRTGLPDNPRGWLIRVASRRLIDLVRSERARLDREDAEAARSITDTLTAPPADALAAREEDDTLQVLLLCCHPALSSRSQVELTLRAVAGLTTAQIASAFLMPTASMGRRISRAKSTLRQERARLAVIGPEELPDRIAAALQVLYLMYNEGHTATTGDQVVNRPLTAEAIRLVRQLRRCLPDHAEVAGLTALMLLTDSRAAARTIERPDGAFDLVPLAEQDRSRWDHVRIAEGTALLEEVLPRGHLGPFCLQAAIAAVHAEAPTWADTDWAQVTELYRMLDRHTPSATITLNLAVAVSMVDGPEAGLRLVEPLLELPEMARHHRCHAVRAHLLEQSGDLARARQEYLMAASLTTSTPEQRYLNGRAERLDRPRA